MSIAMHRNGGLSRTELPIQLFDDEISRIKQYCEDEYKWDWLGNFHSIDIPEPLVQSVIDRVGVDPDRALVLVVMPDVIIPPHIDTRYKGRSTCITWAIQPSLEDAAPTLFYDMNDNVIYSHKYNQNAYIMNTMVPHGMINNGNIRYLFQLTYDIPHTQLTPMVMEHINEQAT